MKNSEFIEKYCNVFFEIPGHDMILCALQFGNFDWPNKLDYETDTYIFVCQEIMDNEDKNCGGKARYRKITYFPIETLEICLKRA